MSKFQLILLAVFGSFILIAVMIFSLTRASGVGSATVTVWGDIPAYDWANFENVSGLNQDRNLVVTYVEKNPETMIQEYTEALAEGQGPDLIILPTSDLWKQKNRLIPIPYSNVSERDFKATFIEHGELFLTPEGIYALPLTIDPLVLYYNRDLLSRAGIATPLTHWDQVFEASGVLTERDPAGNIVRSVMALGEANNIPHHKDILSLLFLQAGTSITGIAGDGSLRSMLSFNPGVPLSPAESALDFYTQFSNPSRAYYSWNRSQLPAETHFTAGDSAYYIGYASELRMLRAKNPTLNLGVAPVPQSRVSDRVITYGQHKGLAISRSTKNPSAALNAALKIVSRETASTLAKILVLPPARRDLLSTRPTDAVMATFFDSAIQSRGWVDPDSERTQSIFREMIESVTSGRARVSEAVGKANRELETLTR